MKKNKRYKRRRGAVIKLRQFPGPNEGIIYKREKNTYEISGPAQNVKSLIWFDLITSKLQFKFLSAWVLHYFLNPKAILTLLWKLVKSLLF